MQWQKQEWVLYQTSYNILQLYFNSAFNCRHVINSSRWLQQTTYGLIWLIQLCTESCPIIINFIEFLALSNCPSCTNIGNVKIQYQFRSFDPSPDLVSSSDQVPTVVDDCTSVVDCQRLTQSVRCLPLHQRLHIDDALLDVWAAILLLHTE